LPPLATGAGAPNRLGPFYASGPPKKEKAIAARAADGFFKERLAGSGFRHHGKAVSHRASRCMRLRALINQAMPVTN